MARMMARHSRLTASECLDAPGSLVIPVPLARWRLWRRGYNQAGLIARALARDSAAALMLAGLVRRRATASSGGLGRKQRFQNVLGAFRVADKSRPQITGSNVLYRKSKRLTSSH